jgi:hypothetical protein
MASERQIAANRANAAKSTGPKTEEGKLQSSQNAVRHGLTAETVITVFESAADYEAFETLVISECEPQSALEYQLVARLTSLLWRLRRAVAIETGLFATEAELLEQEQRVQVNDARSDPIHALRRLLSPKTGPISVAAPPIAGQTVDATQCFLRLSRPRQSTLKKIGRYETVLWRQVAQTIGVLGFLRDPRINAFRYRYPHQRRRPIF